MAEWHRPGADRPLRVGVVGVGFAGSQHVEAVRRLAGVRVEAVAASSGPRAQEAARRLGVPRWFADARALIDDDRIDVVHVCTPNEAHYEIAVAALEAGRHVVCEKPLARDGEQARNLAKVAARSPGLAVLCQNYRFYPMVIELRRRVACGDLGTVHSLRGHYLQDWLLHDTDTNWRLDSARAGRSRAVADIGSHWVDLAEVVTGRRVARVWADFQTVHARRRGPERPTFAQSPHPIDASDVPDRWFAVDTEDAATLVLRLEDDLRATVHVSQVAAGHKNDLELSADGSAGSATWRQEVPDRLWIGRRDLPNEEVLRGGSGSMAGRLPAGHVEGWADGLHNLLAAAYAVIRGEQAVGGLPMPLPTFEDGLRHHLMIEAALESARLHDWVAVDRVGADAAGRATEAAR